MCLTSSNNVFVWGLCSQNKHPKRGCSHRKCRVSYFILHIYRPNGNLNTRFSSLPYYKCTVLRFIVLLRRVGWFLFVCLIWFAFCLFVCWFRCRMENKEGLGTVPSFAKEKKEQQDIMTSRACFIILCHCSPPRFVFTSQLERCRVQ